MTETVDVPTKEVRTPQLAYNLLGIKNDTF